MITTITLEQAIEKSPSIDCPMQSIKLSDKYKIISTKEVLTKAVQNGWNILDSFQLGTSVTTQHYVSLLHDDVLNNINLIKNGYPFVYIVNSHDGTQKFKYTISYHTFDMKTNIIADDSYMNDICLNHKKTTTDDAFLGLEKTKSYFVPFLLCIESFKNRFLNENEKTCLSNFYLKKNILKNTSNDIWTVSNIISNTILKKKRSLTEKFKVSQKIWKLMCASLIFNNETFIQFIEKTDD